MHLKFLPIDLIGHVSGTVDDDDDDDDGVPGIDEDNDGFPGTDGTCAVRGHQGCRATFARRSPPHTEDTDTAAARKAREAKTW